jgi:hypothetical protein
MTQRSAYDGKARIPLALQTIFLRGNRGMAVDTPPPKSAAMKTFRRWNRRSESPLGSTSATETTDNGDGDNSTFESESKVKVAKKRKVWFDASLHE